MNEIFKELLDRAQEEVGQYPLASQDFILGYKAGFCRCGLLMVDELRNQKYPKELTPESTSR